MEKIGAKLDVWRGVATTVEEKARRAEMYSARTRHPEHSRWEIELWL